MSGCTSHASRWFFEISILLNQTTENERFADDRAPRAQAKPSFDLWCYTRDESRPLEADVQA
jgi:hypothetical protein